MSDRLAPMPFAAALAGMATLGLATGLAAQEAVDRTGASADDAFVVQAGENTQPRKDHEDAPSKVYFPEPITAENVAAARTRAARQEQLATQAVERSTDAGASLKQLSSNGDANGGVAQLSDGNSLPDLNQLSEVERQVLLEAIEGTDICDNPPDVEMIRQLCTTRIETRSTEFAAREVNTLSAEERLLGEGLDSSVTPNIEAVIERLARNVGQASNFENQAIASVALAGRPTDAAQPGQDNGEAGSELSAETQTLVNAIIQQLGGGAPQ